MKSISKQIAPTRSGSWWGRATLALCASFLFGLLLTAGCARGPEIRPAPEARVVPGEEKGAVGLADGVRMVAKGDTWSGRPGNLEEILTPIEATIENRSGKPIQIRYNNFVLVSPAGFRSYALPPHKIEATTEEPVPTTPLTPGFFHRDFYVAPYHRPFYGPHLRAWSDPFFFDPLYYRRHYARWPVELPTDDMLRKAIPEGVLEDNGRVSGFFYFQNIGEDISRFSVNAELVNAETGETFGMVSIPFVVG